jgi:hypothetical protein
MSPTFTPVAVPAFHCTACLDAIPFAASRHPCRQCPAVLCGRCVDYHFHGERNPRIRVRTYIAPTRRKG